jgi:hypothetical protein
METKQTAVEKLTAMQHLINWIDSDCTPMDCVMKAKELLQMEKEQIESAVIFGDYRGKVQTYINTEDYYNETYGK